MALLDQSNAIASPDLEAEQTEAVNIEDQIQAEIEAMDSAAWEKIGTALTSLASELDRLAVEQVTKKILIEQRWLEDLRQYHGRYSADTEQKLRDADKSQVFANLTRPKTHAWAARLGDMLLPTDDRNWGINPRPDAELVDDLQESGYQARSLTRQANRHLEMASHKQSMLDDFFNQKPAQQMQAPSSATPPPPPDQSHPFQGQIQGHQDAATRLQAAAAEHAAYAVERRSVMEEAKDKADAMQDEIDGQLTTAKWNIQNRVAILDMCKLGVCVMRGPVTRPNTRGAWTTDGNVTKLDFIEDPKPEAGRVDPWNWFPDMSARNGADKEFDFIRHLYGKRAMQKLAKKPGFNRDAIRRILKSSPPDAPPNYLTLLREISGNPNISVDKAYIIWEYHGSITGTDLRRLAVALLSPPKAAKFLATMQDDDPLVEQDVILWFGHGEIIKFGPHPLDSGEHLINSTCFLEDDSSLFGYGVPYIMRNSQSVVNGSWRMMMDNGGVSAGPQVVVNEKVISPADGVMNIVANKLWVYQQGKTLPPNSMPPFQVFNIVNNQEQLIELVKLALEFIDIEISLPLIAQGEQGSHPETSGGRSMLMNSANVIFRWVVKNWDDNITTPMIQKFYDWNMQHSKIDYIKGDYIVEARGSSVLLVRDMQAQNLAGILDRYSNHPVLGPITKAASAYRKLVQCYGISPDDIVKTDDEIEADQEAKQNTPPPPDANEVRMQIAQLEDATKRLGLTFNRDTVLSQIAAKSNLTLEQVKAKLDMHDKDLAQEERLYAADLAKDINMDAADRAATREKESLIAARTGKARLMPKETHQAATDGTIQPAPSSEVSGDA